MIFHTILFCLLIFLNKKTNPTTTTSTTIPESTTTTTTGLSFGVLFVFYRILLLNKTLTCNFRFCGIYQCCVIIVVTCFLSTNILNSLCSVMFILDIFVFLVATSIIKAANPTTTTSTTAVEPTTTTGSRFLRVCCFSYS